MYFMVVNIMQERMRCFIVWSEIGCPQWAWLSTLGTGTGFLGETQLVLQVAAQVENKIKPGPAPKACACSSPVSQNTGISTELYVPPLIGKVQLEGKPCDRSLRNSGARQRLCKTQLPRSKSVLSCGQTQTWGSCWSSISGSKNIDLIFILLLPSPLPPAPSP